MLNQVGSKQDFLEQSVDESLLGMLNQVGSKPG